MNRLILLLGAATLILLAFGVRVHLLGAQSLWHDEGNSVVQAGRDFAAIAANAARDIHPPGYYWLLAIWRVLMGESEFALRALSMVASVITTALVWAAGKRLYGTLPAFTAAGLFALNTFSIYYAQEARMYALLTLWGAFALYALLRLFDTLGQPQLHRRNIAVWSTTLALVNAAGLWTHYSYPFVMLAQGVLALAWIAGLAFNRQPNRFSAAASTVGIYTGLNVVTLLLFSFWLPTALERITTWPNTGETIPAEQALVTIFGWLSFGVTYEATGAAFAIVQFLMLFGLLLFADDQKQAQWWRILVPVLWVIVPVGLFLLFGLFRAANLKFLLPAQIGLALWIGRGIWVLWEMGVRGVVRARGASPLLKNPTARRWITRLAASLALVWLAFNLWAGLDPLYHAPQFQRDNYRGIAQTIDTQAREGDAIILNAPNQQEVFNYYYDGDLPVYPLPQGLGGDNAATAAAVRDVMARYQRVYAVYWGMDERDPNRIVENTLSSGTFQLSDTWFGSVRLVPYVMPVETYAVEREVGVHFGENITLQSYALSSETIDAGEVLQVRLTWTTDAPLDRRYKVFVQLLSEGGELRAQRDSEPGGGLQLTTTWAVNEPVQDNHGLLIPNDLPAAHYVLIVGLYDLNDPAARLSAAGETYLELGTITVNQP